MIRPELRGLLKRWSETLIAGAIIMGGLWFSLRGGWFFAAIGGAVILIGAALSIGAWRRLPFLRQVASPGMVEIDEGVVRYFGARALGGEIALRDLIEIRLLHLQGHGYWRLRSNSGEALLIPVDAAGADALAHAFSALPGLDMGAVSSALAHLSRQTDAMRTLWRRAD